MESTAFLYRKLQVVSLMIVSVSLCRALALQPQTAPADYKQTCDSIRGELNLLLDQSPALLNKMLEGAHDRETGLKYQYNLEQIKTLMVFTLSSYFPACPSRRPGGSGTSPSHQPPGSADQVKTDTPKPPNPGVEPGKYRARRSGGSSDVQLGSDYLVVGDAAIPLELFQAQDKGNEEEKNQITLELTV